MSLFLTAAADPDAPQQLLRFFDQLDLSGAVPALITLAVGLLLTRAILKLTDRSLARSRLEKAAAGLIRSLLKVTLYVLLGLTVASRLGVDVSGFVALASVASLALSLALQDALANVIGGFTLLSTHPFKSSDYVEIAGQAGTVQTIDLTYTKLSTIDNKIVSIPNSAVVASQIINYSASGTRRIDIAVRVSYETDPEAVRQALLRASQTPSVLADPAPLSGLRCFTESSAEYVLQVWTEGNNYWTTTFAVNENVRREFEAAGIRFAPARMDVQLRK